MKIFLPFQIKDIGGTSTFARKFKDGMEKAGHHVTFDYTTDYDVLFLIVQCPLKYLIDAKRRGKKIVQRLDGTYYWTVSSWKFPLLNAKAAYIRHFFTTTTIYQSEYSKASANRFLGKKRDDRHAIIYNGVDLEHFRPQGNTAKLRTNASQRIFFTASAFRRLDQIAPIIEAVQHYRQRYGANNKLVIAGTFRGKVAHYPEKLKALEFVTVLGKVNNNDLPQYERAADVFVFTHLNPPCPNNIIESLACGLPVCGVADGAMPELITDGKNGLLAPPSGGGVWKMRTFDKNAFVTNMNNLSKETQRFRRASRDTAVARFSLEDMIQNYLTVLGETVL